MINLTNVFLNSAPSRFKLPFGVSKNVSLIEINNEVKRDKNGVKIAKNCYITFGTVDVENENKVTAQSTFSYFNIDKPAFAIQNFIHQFNQLTQIGLAVVPKDKQKAFNTALSKQLVAEKDVFMQCKSAGVPSAKLTKAIGETQIRVVNAFVDLLKPYQGPGNGDLVQLAVVTDTKGKFLDLPREDKGFISKMEGGREVTIDAKYHRWHANKDKAEKASADNIGDEEIISEEAMVIQEEELDL
jgi:NACalpha-BTF3-like transcription factor